MTIPDITNLTRNEVVPYYRAMIIELQADENYRGGDETVKTFNQAIIDKWSVSALEYIKSKAWK